MIETNVRRKSVAGWGRKYEAICPDCGEIRGLKKPHPGLLVSRCHSCAGKQVSKTLRLPWRWVYLTNTSSNVSKKHHGSPCIIVQCVDCQDKYLIQRQHLNRIGAKSIRCARCSLSHMYKCPVIGDRMTSDLRARFLLDVQPLGPQFKAREVRA